MAEWQEKGDGRIGNTAEPFRRTSRPFFPQPEGTRVFWPLATSLVAHGLYKPTSLLAPGQKPKSL